MGTQVWCTKSRGSQEYRAAQKYIMQRSLFYTHKIELAAHYTPDAILHHIQYQIVCYQDTTINSDSSVGTRPVRLSVSIIECSLPITLKTEPA